ncbi:MAG: hypothetical protein ACTSYB_01505 [Candidatus Helarchaeota archaeon]
MIAYILILILEILKIRYSRTSKSSKIIELFTLHIVFIPLFLSFLFGSVELGLSVLFIMVGILLTFYGLYELISPEDADPFHSDKHEIEQSHPRNIIETISIIGIGVLSIITSSFWLLFPDDFLIISGFMVAILLILIGAPLILYPKESMERSRKHWGYAFLVIGIILLLILLLGISGKL